MVRTAAAGYGCIYFCENIFNQSEDSIEGKSVAVFGSGNVAIYAVDKPNQLGAKVVTMPDSSGFIHDPDGIDEEKLDFVKDMKEVRRGRIQEYVQQFPKATFHKGERPWPVTVDVAVPCATQNEINADKARLLLKNGVRAVSEGANMHTELNAAHEFLNAGILYASATAANAGGVAVSGLEQSQNALRLSWSYEEVDRKLQAIHCKCVGYGSKPGEPINYADGANIAGFVKVADAMLAYEAV